MTWHDPLAGPQELVAIMRRDAELASCARRVPAAWRRFDEVPHQDRSPFTVAYDKVSQGSPRIERDSAGSRRCCVLRLAAALFSAENA